MARTATARKPAISQRPETRIPATRTPAIIAIEQIAFLSSRDAPLHKITGRTREIIAGWRAGGIHPSTLRDELEALLTDLGVEAAENYVSEAETDGQRKGAQAQFDVLAALEAAVETLAATQAEI